MVPVRRLLGGAKLQGLIANHMMIATRATTMPAHTNGATYFEPPLRGESLAALSNSPSIQNTASARPPTIASNQPLRT